MLQINVEIIHNGEMRQIMIAEKKYIYKQMMQIRRIVFVKVA